MKKERFDKYNMKENFFTIGRKHTKMMYAALWTALFVMLVPLCDDGSEASERARKLIKGENCCFVTENMPDARPEWKCVKIFEKIKENFGK